MDNKDIIINNALSLFVRKGYDAVGVQEICNLSNITKPTLYHYFGSKKGLLKHIVDYYSDIFFEKLDIACIYDKDIVYTLNNITKLYFQFSYEYKEFYYLQLSAIFSPLESEIVNEFNPFLQKQYGAIEEVFIEASNDHGNMKGRHRDYAYTFLGMINTYIRINNHKINDDVMYKAVNQFMHGIFS